MATTPNYGWVTPAPTDFVTDLPADFETFADAVDADLAGLLGGTTGQYLVKDSNTDHDFSWTTLSAGGYTSLASGNLSGSAVNLTSISGSYKDLLLVLRAFSVSASGNSILLRINNDSNSRYQTGSGGFISSFAFSNTSIKIIDTPDETVSSGIAYFFIRDYANAVSWKLVDGNAFFPNNTTPTEFRSQTVQGFYNQTSAVTELNIITDAGTMDNGTYTLYGIS